MLHFLISKKPVLFGITSKWEITGDCICSITNVYKGTTKLSLQCQLFQLMEQLENTTPHFIRCIKSNTKKIPGVFEKDLVLQQLQCCGILEVVRISRAGYPTRITHQDFTGRWVSSFLFVAHFSLLVVSKTMYLCPYMLQIWLPPFGK